MAWGEFPNLMPMYSFFLSSYTCLLFSLCNANIVGFSSKQTLQTVIYILRQARLWYNIVLKKIKINSDSCLPMNWRFCLMNVYVYDNDWRIADSQSQGFLKSYLILLHPWMHLPISSPPTLTKSHVRSLCRVITGCNGNWHNVKSQWDEVVLLLPSLSVRWK